MTIIKKLVKQFKKGQKLAEQKAKALTKWEKKAKTYAKKNQ